MKGSTWMALLLAVSIWRISGVVESLSLTRTTFGRHHQVQQLIQLGIFSVSSGGTPAEDHPKVWAPKYPVLRFDASSLDESEYGEMIADLREHLLRRADNRSAVPTLPQRDTVEEEDLYILVSITSYGGAVATFAIDVMNVYVVGYRVRDTRYFFQAGQGEDPGQVERLLFIDVTTPVPPRRSSNYRQLENRANQRRATIPLGLSSLAQAITTLQTRPEDARSLLVVIQMVSEAVRFSDIENRVRMQPSFEPGDYIVALQNNWQALSEQVQSSIGLVFQRSITIAGQVADSVLSPVVAGLALLLYVCDPPRRPTTMTSHHLEMVVPADHHHHHLEIYDEMEEKVAGGGTCNVSRNQPARRMIGRDALCVDVEGFLYRDNTSIILFDCRDADTMNQQWTLEVDGRVTSMTKCMWATGSRAGSGVVIHECGSAAAALWTLTDTGSLRHRGSGLVLTATRGSRSQLTLQSNIESSWQAWTFATDLSARMAEVNIRGQHGNCIYYDGSKGVYTEQCGSNPQRQRWMLYADSTIRPKSWQGGCMELKSLARNYNYIQAGRCDWYPEYHRWILTREGAIKNVKSGLVVDEDKGNYLRAAPFHGGLNQIWTIRYF